MVSISVLNVIDGVYWVEVPEINVRILCGAPADIVKHLIKKGFIMNTQKNGVQYETGPNAILLSDSMIQNSSFSNLTEFPVLQMLYRQGMIIPNHPNNDGTKPLLIGNKKQIDIQMEYIFNGNYGLASVEEMMETGIDEELAHNIMRMKLKFAFGNMKKSSDLLDYIDVNNETTTQIKDGLTITRNDHNEFTFEYKGEKVNIDLNLYENQYYTPSYKLGYSEIQREYFSVIHTGEGDGWDIHRPCMGSIITFQGKIYLIDVGPYILETLQALGIGTNEIEGVFQTHAHDDHFAGITSLLQNDQKIKYFCSPVVQKSVIKKLSILLDVEPKQLDIFFDFIDLELDKWNLLDGLEVKPSLSPHPIETNIFYFRTMGKYEYKTYGHLADISSFDVLDSMVTDDKDAMGISQKYCNEVKDIYLEYADIKKIDIGGGMIHGQSKDFINDSSDKLLLSHTSFDLSKDDKTIGSGAAFGTIDVLLPTMRDYDYSHAYRFLAHHFSKAPKSDLEMLLNSDIVTFNPSSIILRENEKVEYIYLVLTGSIEIINHQDNIYNILSSGTIIGEISGLDKKPSTATFRTLGYVRALKIPLPKYLNFVVKNNFFTYIEELHKKLFLLSKTKLFGEFISSKNLETIANNMQKIEVDTIDDELLEQKKIYIVESGTIERHKHGKLFDTLGEGSYINSSMLVYGKKSSSTYKLEKSVSLYAMDIEIFNTIPIVFWKLYLMSLNR